MERRRGDARAASRRLRDFYETAGGRVGSAGAVWNDDKLDDIMSSMPDRNDHGDNADARDMKKRDGGDENRRRRATRTVPR